MLSCDTFALGKARYESGRNLLAKNSDRPLGEAQPLVFFPAACHPVGAELKCTHLTIPQAEKTYAVIGSQPYWIWGFEMGVNECGLAIGNEAEGSRCDAEREEGLLGMDLLRLALERAADARQGVTVITTLLEQYGQNANASMLFDRRYENSFLLVDPQEIWLLETAGRQWCAKKVEDYASISNCYSIGSDWDLSSADLESYARSRRFLRPDEPMDFAKAYTLPAVRQSNAVHRWRRAQKRIGALGVLDDGDAKNILRDHYEGELIEPRFGAMNGTFVSICMHAYSWDSSQTAASFLCSYDAVLGPVIRYAPSLPCCSVYLPVYWTETLPAALCLGSGTYRADSLWWRAERLAMAVSIDEDRFGIYVRNELLRLEDSLREQAKQAEESARGCIACGNREDARRILSSLTKTAADAFMELSGRLAEELCSDVRKSGGLYGPRKEFLEDYCRRSGLPL